MHYAHSLAGRDECEWQKLEDHLNNTAELADSFTSRFAPGWGRIAGLWHDAGKYQKAFQDYISRDSEAHVRGSVDHSTVGALIAKGATPLQFAIAGHHGGIPNRGELAERLRDKASLLACAEAGGMPSDLKNLILPSFPDWLRDAPSVAVFTRMLFSALVDADFLDTAEFYSGGVEPSVPRFPSLAELKRLLDEHLADISSRVTLSPVNAMRARVLEACRNAAHSPRGSFTLTVPTGGGKTLASLAFALDHAAAHGLARVIVVIPFTSIIEQTANTYRSVLGDDAIVEHHSNVDPDVETPANRIASENWDAPVIVTTSVQFFESLYANRPSRCRKLHRIANSVIILDEVQTLPAAMLQPVRWVLAELTANYSSTVLLCTATQPVLLDGAREIVPDPSREFRAASHRCDVVMPSSEEPVTWERLANEIRTHRQAMTIVHRRDDARALAELVGEDCLHLSARMCAKHRSEVLSEVKRRLAQGLPCLLVATQLVEAGVDVDFPYVYRAFAGPDSLAQAAGRCNREGRGAGILTVFNAPTQPPRGILRTAESVGRVMWKSGELDLQRPETFARYFAALYNVVDLDARDIAAAERELRFADVAEAFEMISSEGEPVVAPFRDWQPRVDAIRRDGIKRDSLRRLQRFFVTLHRQEIESLVRSGALERVCDAFWVVAPGFTLYDPRWGFRAGELARDPERLVC